MKEYTFWKLDGLNFLEFTFKEESREEAERKFLEKGKTFPEEYRYGSWMLEIDGNTVTDFAYRWEGTGFQKTCFYAK